MQLCNSPGYRRSYYRKRRSHLIDLLGGKCVICGSTERLEIDHIDPATKEFDISSMVLHTSEKHLTEELQKCQLLCRKCHIQKSKKDLSIMLSGERHPQYKKCGAECIHSKPVIDLDTGEEFCSATDYAEKHGLNKNSVARVCRGEQSCISGHHILYKHLCGSA